MKKNPASVIVYMGVWCEDGQNKCSGTYILRSYWSKDREKSSPVPAYAAVPSVRIFGLTVLLFCVLELSLHIVRSVIQR